MAVVMAGEANIYNLFVHRYILQFHEIKNNWSADSSNLFGGSISSSWEENTMLRLVYGRSGDSISLGQIKTGNWRPLNGRFFSWPLHVHSRVEWSHSRVLCGLNTKLLIRNVKQALHNHNNAANDYKTFQHLHMNMNSAESSSNLIHLECISTNLIEFIHSTEWNGVSLDSVHGHRSIRRQKVIGEWFLWSSNRPSVQVLPGSSLFLVCGSIRGKNIPPSTSAPALVLILSQQHN